MFSVRLSRKAVKQLQRLDASALRRVMELFKVMEFKPIPVQEFDLAKIRGEEDTYRIRLSSYRVLYRIFYEEKTVRIAKVERRSDSTYN